MNEVRHRLYTLLAALAIAAIFLLNPEGLPISRASAPRALDRASELSAERYIRHVEHLASPAMKGRGNGTAELESAGAYTASEFRKYGLRPLGEAGTYFQMFEVTTGVEFGPMNRFEAGGTTLEVYEDFVPLNFSASADVETPVVFAGYGITAPEIGYDDYSGVEVTGKTVVVFRHEPQETDPGSPFNGTHFTRHASFMSKAINAKLHGAKGIVFITDPNNHAGEEDQVGPATRATQNDDAGIAAVHARREPVMELFSRSRSDLSTLQERIDRELEPQSLELADIRIRLSTDLTRTRKPVRNVIAALDGSDPTLQTEWIVAGAHYDHLGLGGRGSLSPSSVGQIHHGADDNASGTAGILELARVAASNSESFERSVLFVAFAGEEMGLLGSANFVNNPTVPLDQMVTMINLDMIGRLTNDRVFVGGVGTSPDFKPWIEEFSSAVGLEVDISDSGYGSSDHTSFTIKKIPALFFFSGLHRDYHRPTDTAEKINSRGARKVLMLAYQVLEQLATGVERPEYTEVEAPRRPVGGGYGAYFGSIPDFSNDAAGVRFAHVREGSPAEAAGLEGGDVLVEFDGQPIENLYDFTYALRAKKNGDVVTVVVERNGKRIRRDVTLGARP